MAWQERKRCVARLDKVRNGIALLDKQLDALRSSELDKELMSSLRASSQAMKRAGIGMDADEAEKVMNELEDQIHEASEVTNVLATPLNAAGDLDGGAETYQADAAQPDFWYEQMTSTTRQLVPQGGAAFAVYGSTEPGYEACAATVLSTAPISGSDPNHGLLPVGTWAATLVLDLPPNVEAAMILVAACPGGSLSNVVTHFGRGRCWPIEWKLP